MFKKNKGRSQTGVPCRFRRTLFYGKSILFLFSHWAFNSFLIKRIKQIIAVFKNSPGSFLESQQSPFGVQTWRFHEESSSAKRRSSSQKHGCFFQVWDFLGWLCGRQVWVLLAAPPRLEMEALNWGQLCRATPTCHLFLSLSAVISSAEEISEGKAGECCVSLCLCEHMWEEESETFSGKHATSGPPETNLQKHQGLIEKTLCKLPRVDYIRITGCDMCRKSRWNSFGFQRKRSEVSFLS